MVDIKIVPSTNGSATLLAICETGEMRLERAKKYIPHINQAMTTLICDFYENSAMLVMNLHSQWCNGGIQQWADNGYAETDADNLLTILGLVNDETCTRVAEMVEEAIEVYESDEFVDCDEEDDDYRVALVQLEALDTEYYAMGEKMVDAVATWLLAMEE